MDADIDAVDSSPDITAGDSASDIAAQAKLRKPKGLPRTTTKPISTPSIRSNTITNYFSRRT
jgi:hypothetical protein